MKEYKFVKEFGEGVKRIYREMDEANLPSPTFKKQAFMTIATIKNNLLESKLQNDSNVEPHAEPLNEPHAEPLGNIIDLIAQKIGQNKRISKAQLAKDLGVSISTIKRALKKSNIEFIGTSRDGHWEIISDDSNKNDNQ